MTTHNEQIVALATGSAGREFQVDKINGVIRGVVIAKAGPTKDERFTIDGVSMAELIRLGNDYRAGSLPGPPSRWKHPIEYDQSGRLLIRDGLGTFVGRFQNFRRDADLVLADLHLDEVAKALPEMGDLWSHIVGLAQRAPDTVGASIFGLMRAEPNGDAPPALRPVTLDYIDLVGDPDASFGLSPAMQEELIRFAASRIAELSQTEVSQMSTPVTPDPNAAPAAPATPAAEQVPATPAAAPAAAPAAPAADPAAEQVDPNAPAAAAPAAAGPVPPAAAPATPAPAAPVAASADPVLVERARYAAILALGNQFQQVALSRRLADDGVDLVTAREQINAAATAALAVAPPAGGNPQADDRGADPQRTALHREAEQFAPVLKAFGVSPEDYAEVAEAGNDIPVREFIEKRRERRAAAAN